LHPPLLDLPGGRVYVLLQTGAVDGFTLVGGTPLRGFPAPSPDGDLPPFGYRAALYSPWNALVMTQADGRLRRIALEGGVVSHITVPNARRLSGVAVSGGRLYAVDDASGTLLRLNADGQVTATLPLNRPAGCQCYYLEAVGRPGTDSVALFLASSQSNSPNSRVAPIFEEHATPQIRAQIKELSDLEAQRRFHTLQLSPAQRKEIDDSVTMMKRSYLQNTLGYDKTASLLADEALVLVQAVTDNGAGMKLSLDDAITGYSPETGTGVSPAVYPVVHASADGLTLVVPLNHESGDRPQDEYQSLIRIYRLP
jgi:hypothetical protein